MKNVAIFDFDDTLIKGDSLMPFLRHVAGSVATYQALAIALLGYIVRKASGKPFDHRTFIKEQLLRKLLGKRQIEDITKAAIKTRAWRKINQPVLDALHAHRNNGDIIVIASGSLDIYLPLLLTDIPHDVLICTDIGIEHGKTTGEMTNGNCVRARKAERVKQWLDANGPFQDSFGYGNAPHDLPMLNLVNHKNLI